MQLIFHPAEGSTLFLMFTLFIRLSPFFFLSLPLISLTISRRSGKLYFLFSNKLDALNWRSCSKLERDYVSDPHLIRSGSETFWWLNSRKVAHLGDNKDRESKAKRFLPLFKATLWKIILPVKLFSSPLLNLSGHSPEEQTHLAREHITECFQSYRVCFQSDRNKRMPFLTVMQGITQNFVQAVIKL